MEVDYPKYLRHLRRHLAGAAMLLAFTLPAVGQVRVDEVRAETLIKACAGNDPAAFLAERLTGHGLSEPEGAPDQALELSVDRALAPENNPERAAEALAALIAREGGSPEHRHGLQFYVLKNFAYFQALNCQALGRDYRQLVAYRDLLERAGSGDPNRDYFARSIEQSQGKLALALRVHDRLIEKERIALKIVGLAAW